MTHAAQQPMRDLSLIREAAPAALVRAWESPYRVGGETCAALTVELANLDSALGPDLADGAKPGNGVSVSGLASDLVEGAVGIPFRGIVRTVSGAQQRDRELRAAVLAGMVRRGFVKGRMREMTCPAPPAPMAMPAPAQTK